MKHSDSQDPDTLTFAHKKTWALNAIRTTFETIRIEDKLIEMCGGREVFSPFSDTGLSSVDMAIEVVFNRPKKAIDPKLYGLVCELGWELCFDYRVEKGACEIKKIEKNAHLLFSAIFQAAKEECSSLGRERLVEFCRIHCPHLKLSIFSGQKESSSVLGGGGGALYVQ